MKTFIELWPILTWFFTVVIVALIPLMILTNNDQKEKILFVIQITLLVIQLICFIIYLVFRQT